MEIINIVLEVMDNPVNTIVVITIILLAVIEVITKKDLKSQIVSLGVLGTFIGIFMGLQDFNPADMKNSINGILLGLKTAFFTSIVSMSVALILAILEKLLYKNVDNSLNQESILLEISNKLNNLDRTEDTNKIIGELERLRTIQTDTRDETVKISTSIEELKINSNQENQKLIYILDTNFDKMNNSLEIAIEKLSKGATEEIIKALEQVIQEFNQELQSSFGDNFVKLNESVINLLQWQNNYKTHIEQIEESLNVSTASIEKSKDSLEIISSKNRDIIKIYQVLAEIIQKNQEQVNLLNEELKTYGHLSNDARNMFPIIKETIETTQREFKSLTEYIKNENSKQINYNKEMFEKNKRELDVISNHFKNLGEQIPKALNVSLSELNRGLTSLTIQFQKDYKEILEKHNEGLN